MSGRRTESLTLLVAGNKAGYYGVKLDKRNAKSKPYKAQVWRGGKMAHLGSFTTAEGAALCVARSPEGRAAAQRVAATPTPLTSEEARQQAQAEGLVLLVADNTTGYFGVIFGVPGPKPFQAKVRCAGKMVHMGQFATAEEAALCVARSPEGKAAAQRAAAAPPLTSEEARQQAQAEGLTLLVADSETGYSCVRHNNPGQPKAYQARVRRDGKQVSLGSFTTAGEAALCFARSPEGWEAAVRVAVAPPLRRSEEGMPWEALAMPPNAFVMEEEIPSMSTDAFFKDEEVVSLMTSLMVMPPDEAVKREHAVIADEGGRSDGRPKRRRLKEQVMLANDDRTCIASLKPLSFIASLL